MALKSMALTKAEAAEMEMGCIPNAKGEDEADDLPKYPYGLTMYLDDDVLTKLGLKTVPNVGSTLTLMANVTVTSVGMEQTQGGEPEQRIQLQITDMDLVQSVNDRMAKAATKLYPDTDD